MSGRHTPEALEVDHSTADVLQELQVVLGVEDHHTEGLALEAALVWYDDTIKAGDALRFVPPPTQPNWLAYIKSLGIDPEFDDGETPASGAIRVDGRARRRLAESEELLTLATRQGLAQIVRLKAEHAFRLADGWTVEVKERATQ